MINRASWCSYVKYIFRKYGINHARDAPVIGREIRIVRIYTIAWWGTFLSIARHQLHVRVTRSHEILFTSLRRESLIYLSEKTFSEVGSDQRRSSLEDSKRHCIPCRTSFPSSPFFLLFLLATLDRIENGKSKWISKRSRESAILRFVSASGRR